MISFRFVSAKFSQNIHSLIHSFFIDRNKPRFIMVFRSHSYELIYLHSFTFSYYGYIQYEKNKKAEQVTLDRSKKKEN
jgi:hypothetical protein